MDLEWTYGRMPSSAILWQLFPLPARVYSPQLHRKRADATRKGDWVELWSHWINRGLFFSRICWLTERVRFSADHDSDGVVVKNGGHVFRGKFVGRVGNQETSLANRTVPNNHAFDSLHLVWGVCIVLASRSVLWMVLYAFVRLQREEMKKKFVISQVTSRKIFSCGNTCEWLGKFEKATNQWRRLGDKLTSGGYLLEWRADTVGIQPNQMWRRCK